MATSKRNQHLTTSTPNTGESGRTSKGFGLIRGHRPKVLQIALVPDEHDHDVRIGVVPELLKPPSDVRIRLVFRDIVDEQCTNRTAVICRRNGTIAFLASCMRPGKRRLGGLWSKGAGDAGRVGQDSPVSQICALTVLPSIASERVANSTPIVDLDSRLNSLRVNRERTVFSKRMSQRRPRIQIRVTPNNTMSNLVQSGG
jgi:hypothetical protein